MSTATEQTGRVHIGTLESVQQRSPLTTRVGRRTVVVWATDEGVFAFDNRCPHMGFPLNRGTVKDGILTCHWHHARFDLAGGCTFDPFADDVAVFRVEVLEGQVYLSSPPPEGDRREHWLQKLDEGLEQQLSLVLAKSVIALHESGDTGAILSHAASFGTRNRAAGWSSGLSILTALANVMPGLRESDRVRALHHGVLHVANSTASQPPDFDLQPLRTTVTRPEVYRTWFRNFIETRSADPAERCLRTAIRMGFGHRHVADMILAACTDHVFLDEGHALDFANKSFELLDHIGWDQAEDVLPSLIPVLVRAERMEETSAWRHPVDLPALLKDAEVSLDGAIAEGGERDGDWAGHRELAEQVLDGEPTDTLQALLAAIHSGARLSAVSSTVAYAAARRALHFHVSNEFGDWDTVHHTFTYTNAVDQAMRRAPSRELVRAVFDGAMSVYLERFLNVPKQPIPQPAPEPATPEDLLEQFDHQRRVDETAEVVASMLAGGRHAEVIELLGYALLREDAGFHQFQIYEAAVRQFHNFEGAPEGNEILVGAARFLTAHAPTVRASGQTFQIAVRLHRGEALDAMDT